VALVPDAGREESKLRDDETPLVICDIDVRHWDFPDPCYLAISGVGRIRRPIAPSSSSIIRRYVTQGEIPEGTV